MPTPPVSSSPVPSLNAEQTAVLSSPASGLMKVAVTRLSDSSVQLSFPNNTGLPRVELETRLLNAKQLPASLFAGITSQQQPLLIEQLPINKSVTLSPQESQKLLSSLSELMAKQQLTIKDGSPSPVLRGEVTATQRSLITMQVTLPGNPTVSIPVPNNGKFEIGDKVELQMTQAAGGKWAGTLSTDGKPMIQTKDIPHFENVAKLAIARQLASTGISIEGKIPPTLTDLSQLNALGKTLTSGNEWLSARLSLKGSQLQLTGSLTRPVAKLPDNSAQAVIRPIPESLDEHIKTTHKAIPAIRFSEGAPQSPQLKADSVKPVETDKSSGKSELRTPTVPLQDDLKAFEKITQLSRQLLAETGSTKQALQQLITLLDKSSTQAGSTTSAVARDIVQQLRQGVFTTQNTDTVSNKVLQSLTSPLSMKNVAAGQDPAAPSPQKILPGLIGKQEATLFHETLLHDEPSGPKLPNSADTPSVKMTPQQQSATQIQQLLTGTALVTTPTALLSPVSSSPFISGLITLLQLSLAGKALRSQPDLQSKLDKPGSLLSKNPTVSTSGTSPSRLATEFSQLDNRGLLTSSIKTLLANHQQQKIQNSEGRLQGQESLYFLLPVGGDGCSPPEMVLRREEKHSHDPASSKDSSRIWNLTMKLDVGDTGEMLAKTRIDNEEIALHLYCSTDALLAQVFDTLPYLLRRLASLGLKIDSHSCQRGKIPESLKDAPYQIFETSV